MSSLKRKDEDFDEDLSPFADLRKNIVIRESKIFNDQQLNPSKCSQVLTKLLYLITHGEILSSDESLEVFFAVTKLFQSSDTHLRRLIYLMIKELNIESDSSLIVVSCLSKDMTSKIDLFRANSIRVLSGIMDNSMVGQMERFLKQSLVDKNPFIVASTLTAGQHLVNIAPEVIKRWVNEIQESLNNKARMVQYHALALLYKIRSHDKLAINKIIQALAKNQQLTHSPMASVLYIRIVANLITITPNGNNELIKYLHDALHNKQSLVSFEAARTLCNLENISAAQLVPAISVLQEMLNSSSSVHRFAAVRCLSNLVVRYPVIVQPCAVDLEHLITDTNRSIATLAITTLLKTGVESNVDRLMKSISGFMADISDEFKIVLVEAIRALCLKFPHKFPTLLNFLASALREEGGYKYKKSIVDSMLVVIAEIPESREIGLEHFCEFIEDCEFPELSVRILHLLGDKGPTTNNPARYIRFIFNRVILETASVRCAAVTSLAMFGSAVPQLQDNIVVLLKRCLNDNDDEVRDRAVFYLNMLQSSTVNARLLSTASNLPSPHQLEVSLQNYLTKLPAESFDVKKHLVKVEEEITTNDTTDGFNKGTARRDERTDNGTSQTSTQSGIGISTPSNPHAELLESIPELKALGTVFRSSAPVELTESETEYVVVCIKHILPNHVLFQFNVTNNMEEQLLENVTVDMEAHDEAWSEELSIPETSIPHQQTGATFVAFTRPQGVFTSGSISCTLHFTVREVEDGVPTGTGHQDEYRLEDIEVTESDFMKSGEEMGLVEFRRNWEQLGEQNSIEKKYSLGLDSFQSAVNAVIELLGMHPIENSNQVPENTSRGHAINLTGIFFGPVNVFARAGFSQQAQGLVLKIAVRSTNTNVNNMLANAIR